jgi:hypothetical protein
LFTWRKQRFNSKKKMTKRYLWLIPISYWKDYGGASISAPLLKLN